MSLNLVDTRVLATPFEYFEPANIKEAVDLLVRYGERAAVLAGGTDLLIKMKQRLTEPKYVINIKKIAELKLIEDKGDFLSVGPAANLIEIENLEVVGEKFPALREAIMSIGALQIRCMATLGGNLCNASPAADSAPALLVLGTRVKLLGSGGARAITLDEFWKGPGKTAMRPGELLVEIQIPYPPPGTGTSFLRLTRAAVDIAKVNAAALLTIQENVVYSCGIALGSVAPTTMRAKKAEALLLGKKVTDKAIAQAAQTASEEIKPITDIRSTARYRVDTSRVLVRRALRIAWDRSSGRR
jgi:carbon-monoxide dehydrogenase medium subunit